MDTGVAFTDGLFSPSTDSLLTNRTLDYSEEGMGQQFIHIDDERSTF